MAGAAVLVAHPRPAIDRRLEQFEQNPSLGLEDQLRAFLGWARTAAPLPRASTVRWADSWLRSTHTASPCTSRTLTQLPTVLSTSTGMPRGATNSLRALSEGAS